LRGVATFTADLHGRPSRQTFTADFHGRLSVQGNPVSDDPDDRDDDGPPDEDGPDLPWRRMVFLAALGLGLVAVIVYLYVVATGH
jgi:hypothetical protein